MANQVLYGFHELKDVFGERVVGSNIPLVTTAIQQAVEEHNRQMSALIGLFSDLTTEPTARFVQASAHRLQPLDDNGRARPIKPKGFYDVGFPLQEAGSAWGANYVTRVKMTVEQANRVTASMLIADNRWMRDHILAALFANGDWVFPDDVYGNITVRPLANGDSTTYHMFSGVDTGASDNHQLAQTAAISDAANPFPNIYKELTEHPENSGDVMVLVPTDLIGAVTNLTSFVRRSNPNIKEAATKRELTGDLGVAVPGVVAGLEDSGCWIVEWANHPAGYMTALTTDGIKPLAERVDPEEELRGFKKVAEREDHPFFESQWLRRAGFGINNRVGALVQRIGNAAYAVPANYTTPMP